MIRLKFPAEHIFPDFNSFEVQLDANKVNGCLIFCLYFNSFEVQLDVVAMSGTTISITNFNSFEVQLDEQKRHMGEQSVCDFNSFEVQLDVPHVVFLYFFQRISIPLRFN